jgi:hypothetical protein
MWRSFCETLSEQGRHAELFILAILLFFAVAPFVAALVDILGQLVRRDNQWAIPEVNEVLVLIGLAAAIWAGIRRCRRHRVQASKNYPMRHPLAPLERINARSKLLKSAK